MSRFKDNLTQLISSTQRPIAIFDIDGTLFDVSYRTLEILKHFSAQPQIKERFATELGLTKKISVDNFKYTLEQNLNHVGISKHSERGAQFIQLANEFWFKTFFTDEYVLFDKPYKGAADCVQWFKKNGVHIVYLSGRDIPNMSRGTLDALERDGFPHNGHGVSVILKPDYDMDDLLFKRQSLEIIKSEGHVVAAFDNEPANVQLFLDEFPTAWSLHFKSAHARPMDLRGERFLGISNYAELGF